MNREENGPFQILVVDDEADIEPLINQRMRPRIRSGKYQFFFASDGIKALEILSENPSIEMIITDINMPNMDGLNLRGRVSLISPNTKSMVISDYGDMRNFRTARNRGAFDFIVKPFEFEDLEVVIKRTQAHIAARKQALEALEKKAESKRRGASARRRRTAPRRQMGFRLREHGRRGAGVLQA